LPQDPTFLPGQHFWNLSHNDTYGLTVLGAPVGTDYYVHRQLRKLHEKWFCEVKELLKQCLSKQLLLHLLRTCFQLKSNYILSVVSGPPAYLFAQSVSNLMNKIVSFILIDTTDYLQSILDNPRIWAQVYLPCDAGGLGLRDPVTTGHTLYLSSYIKCQPTISHYLSSFHDPEHRHTYHFSDVLNVMAMVNKDLDSSYPQAPMHSEQLSHLSSDDSRVQFLDEVHHSRLFPLHSALICFHLIKHLNTHPEKLQPLNWIILQEVAKQKPTALNQYLQKIVLDSIQAHFKTTLTQNVQNLDFSVHYLTTIGPADSRWLLARPSRPEYILTNEEFSTSCLKRLGLPLSILASRAGQNCSCGQLIDPLGRHWITGCSHHSSRQITSENLEECLIKIFHYSGMRVTRQPTHNFQSSNQENSDNLRLDLKTTHPFAPGNPELLIDVSVVQAYPGSGGGLNSLQTTVNQDTWLNILNKPHSRTSAKAAKKKNQKYSDLSHQEGKVFLPFIQEINGHIEPEGFQFIKQLARKAAAERYLPAANVQTFFLNLLSFTLQKSITRSIFTHLHKHPTHHATSPTTTSEDNDANILDALAEELYLEQPSSPLREDRHNMYSQGTL